MILLLLLLVALALLVGLVAGYLLALSRTPAVLAKCSPDQIEALAHKVGARRKEAA